MAISKITGSGLGTINSPVEFTSADNLTQLTITSTDADASTGPKLDLIRNSASPAANDILANIRFMGEDAAGNSLSYIGIFGQLIDPTDGSEDGSLEVDVRLAGTNRSRMISNATETVFNDDSVDLDFRVESNGNTHMLFVDGGSDHVTIGTDTDFGGRLNIKTGDNTVNLVLVSTDADALVGPQLDLYRNSANPADNDVTGRIVFSAENDAGEKTEYTQIITYMPDVSNGSEDAAIQYYLLKDGTSIQRLEHSPTETVFNQDSADVNFRVESNGNANMFLVDGGTDTIGIGTTQMNTVGNNAAGTNLLADGMVGISRAGMPLKINRTSGGAVGMIEFFEAATTRGQIDINGNRILIRSSGDAAGVRFDAASLVFFKNGSASDDAVDLGFGSGRLNDIFATNGTIQTSDRNEKQDIAALTSKEMLVAKRISTLFKTYRWKTKVAEKADKGETARTHTGVIAQDVQDAFTAEGLDAGDYSLFIESPWWEKDVEVAAVEADKDEGIEAADAYTRTDKWASEDEAPEGSTKKTRLGMRYPELLSFLAAYNEQRFAAIETRLTALEDA